MTIEERVVLVDDQDREVGTAEKLSAHRQGVLHRAFSVMIWDDRGRLLLQQRHIGKYHSGGLWSNTCCGHPRPGEALRDAAARRLREEMGFDCTLEHLGSMIYRAELDHGLVEHEFVHVFRGRYNGPLAPDPGECDGFTWAKPEKIKSAKLDHFSAWFQNYLAAGWPMEPAPVAAR